MNLLRHPGAPGAAALLLSAVASTSAHAASPFEFDPRPYVQAAVGQVHETSPSATGTAMDLDGSADSATLRATAGVQLNAWLGVEATWFQLPRSNVSTSVGTARYKGSAYALSVTGTVALPANFAVVGRVGLGQSDVDVNVPATTYASSSRRNLTVWGIGARYAVTPAIAATLDYDHLGAVGKYQDGNSVRASEISVGIRFGF